MWTVVKVIHQPSRCVASESWSPLVGQHQGNGSLVNAADLNVSHSIAPPDFAAFLVLELNETQLSLDAISLMIKGLLVEGLLVLPIDKHLGLALVTFCTWPIFPCSAHACSAAC